MRLALCAMGLLPGLLLGCTSSGDDGYPSRPGNGGTIGGGGSNGVDGGTDGSGGDGQVAIGRVCLITDLRFPTACSATGAKGITVRRGVDTMVTTQEDGRFTLPPTSNLGDRWLVTGMGTTLVPSVVPFVPGAEARLPIISQVDYAAFAQANNITTLDNAGVVHVISRRPNGTPKPGVTITASPVSQTGQLFYAASSPTMWSTTLGASSNVALIPNLLPGDTVTITGDVTSGPDTDFVVPVVEDAITFARLDFLQ